MLVTVRTLGQVKKDCSCSSSRASILAAALIFLLFTILNSWQKKKKKKSGGKKNRRKKKKKKKKKIRPRLCSVCSFHLPSFFFFWGGGGKWGWEGGMNSELCILFLCSSLGSSPSLECSSALV